jgi:hypothetical protein
MYTMLKLLYYKKIKQSGLWNQDLRAICSSQSEFSPGSFHFPMPQYATQFTPRFIPGFTRNPSGYDGASAFAEHILTLTLAHLIL